MIQKNMFTYSGQISIIPKPELFRGFWGSSLIEPPFRVTSADVVIICPDLLTYCLINWTSRAINFESSMWNGPLDGIFYLHDLLIFVGGKGLGNVGEHTIPMDPMGS